MTIYLSATLIVREVAAAAERASRGRKQLLDAIEQVNANLELLRLSADQIELNTGSPVDEGHSD